MLVYNGSQQLVDVGGAGVSGVTAAAQIPVVAGNTYYIQAAGYQGSTGAFHLAVVSPPRNTRATVTPSIQLDARGSASPIGNVSTRGGKNGDQVTATTSGEMTITFAALPGSPIDALLLVYNSSGILVAADNDSTGSQISQVQFTVLTGQTYHVEAGALGLSLGGYGLSISTQDSGDTLAQAQTLTLSVEGTASVSGQVDASGEADYYQFAAPFMGQMAVEEDAAPGSTMRVAPTILDASGNPLPGLSQTAAAGRTSVRLVFPVTAGRV